MGKHSSHVSWCSRAMGTVSARHSLLAEPFNGALMVLQCNGQKLDSLDGTSLDEKDEKRISGMLHRLVGSWTISSVRL